jgi:hypothetical protein
MGVALVDEIELVLTPRFVVLAIATEDEVAMGRSVDADVTPGTLTASSRALYAIDAKRTIVSGDSVTGQSAGRSASKDGPLSEFCVWTTGIGSMLLLERWIGPLLSSAECSAWMARGEALTYETGDFIFKTGREGYERAKTGARRHSATRLVEDPDFASLMTARFLAHGGVPKTLNDGREFLGIRPLFLISKYEPGQYFAPHFDGATVAPDESQMSAFTVVLYLNDDFEGGHTHYLPGMGSELRQQISLRPKRGSAIVHRSLSVLHAGGRLIQGTKHIMQFGLM